MSTVFLVIAILAAIAVVASLATGVVGMARGGAFNAKYGNKLMRARVVLQGIALVFLALALWTA